jgi:hypothetical protein
MPVDLNPRNYFISANLLKIFITTGTVEERYDEMSIALPQQRVALLRAGVVLCSFGDTDDGPAKGSLSSSFHRLRYPSGHNVLVRYLCMYVQLLQQTFQPL